ncbi:erythromycin esterase [Fusarium mundagurra]|uniref:Erythromycin esterase n=1 Tax=Fusarium mundagurra TaxID=1567541 RepID=A0A8H6DNL6_9HYPO|nr:erythromycin esterase [Fusarium mundagurra]
MEVSSAEQLKSNVKPFKSIPQDIETITKYFDSFGDCKVLLIGDPSHGTSEFYSVRAEITKHMIQNHGFNIVAVEADWPDAESVDRYARHRPGPGQATVDTTQIAKEKGREPAFLRFPTWMWRNIEVRDFVEWLWSYNSALKEEEAAGFYGLDLYSMGASTKALVDYLETIDKDMAQVAKGRYSKLIMGWSREELNIGQLCKERFGAQALSIGTGTNTGTVAAAQDWDGNMNIMELQPGLPVSYEELMHAADIDNFVLDLRKGKYDERLREILNKKRLERFIGVLYRLDTEKASHYSYAVLPEQFDGFIWFDKSKRVGTLEVHQPKSPREYHETWPFGL